jgi:hypothetical protein
VGFEPALGASVSEANVLAGMFVAVVPVKENGAVWTVNTPLIANGEPLPESTHGAEPALSSWLEASVSMLATVVVPTPVLVVVANVPLPSARL